MTKKKNQPEQLQIKIPNHTIKNVNIEDQMKTCYIDYAMSVITSRALPDVRDGLKPVHRRILYAMYQMGMTPDKPFRKSARIVGEVLGKYHPHGDSSVYDAMVRMAQDFSTRYPTVRGQGNFGSVDGDGAAAMRYTEAKMSKVGVEMLRDINKNTVDFIDNFDGSEKEPAVLPARFPHLLANGTRGIAVGMASNIPSHNLGELCDGIVAYMHNPDISVEELMKLIKGPDFPTGAIIMGKEGILQAYKTGRGKIQIRSKYKIEDGKRGKKEIIVTEIPYEVNKSALIQKIADQAKIKKPLACIKDIRDESDLKNGMRIVIELKKGADAEKIANYLFKHTDLQTTYSIIMLALADGVPKQLPLKDILHYYVDHQEDVVRRQISFDLDRAEKRAHILEGIKIALDHLDEVIAIIRKAKTVAAAKKELRARFDLDSVQADAILDMRLQRLTNMEQNKVVRELKQLNKRIKDYRAILKSERRIKNIIAKDLEELKEKYGDKRRTKIVKASGDIEEEDYIPQEELTFVRTQDGYVATIGKNADVSKVALKETDKVIQQEALLNTDTVIFFSDKGRYYGMKVHQLPHGKPANLAGLLSTKTNEKIIYAAVYQPNANVVFATAQGLIKKTKMSEYASFRSGGALAIKIRKGDSLVSIHAIALEDYLMVSQSGMVIRFKTTGIHPIGKNASGVCGMKLKEDDTVLNSFPISDDDTVQFAFECTQKTVKGKQYKVQNRGGKGVHGIKILKRDGKLTGINKGGNA